MFPSALSGEENPITGQTTEFYNRALLEKTTSTLHVSIFCRLVNQGEFRIETGSLSLGYTSEQSNPELEEPAFTYMVGGSLQMLDRKRYIVREGFFYGVGTFIGGLLLGSLGSSPAVLSPGTGPGSVGTLNISGYLEVWAPTGRLQIQINSNTDFDKVNVSKSPGALGLDGDVEINGGELTVEVANGFDALVGASFTFLTWQANLSGSFNFNSPVWGSPPKRFRLEENTLAKTLSLVVENDD